MSLSCSICKHSHRDEIENALLGMNAGSPQNTLESIAEHYDVSVEDLKMHAVFHSPSFLGDDCQDSITRRIKLREANVLEAVSNEYMVTLRAMSQRLQRLVRVRSIDVEEEDQQFKVAKMLTKPMVELYVGLGNEIRQNVKAAAELDRMLNGPEDSTGSGLMALANAIKGSQNQ